MQGNVLRWPEEDGASQMPAIEYIAMLEKELAALRKQVGLLSKSYQRISKANFSQGDVVPLQYLPQHCSLSKLSTSSHHHTQVSLRHFQSQNSNELLDYLKGLDTNALSQLTACAGDDIIEAMNAFIHRLLGSSDEEDLRRAPSKSDAVELARLLFWYMPCLYAAHDKCPSCGAI